MTLNPDLTLIDCIAAGLCLAGLLVLCAGGIIHMWGSSERRHREWIERKNKWN